MARYYLRDEFGQELRQDGFHFYPVDRSRRYVKHPDPSLGDVLLRLDLPNDAPAVKVPIPADWEGEPVRRTSLY